MATRNNVTDCTQQIIEKLDKIQKDLYNLTEQIAVNEEQHKRYDELIYELKNKQMSALQAFSWMALIAGSLLSLINLLKYFK